MKPKKMTRKELEHEMYLAKIETALWRLVYVMARNRARSEMGDTTRRFPLSSPCKKGE